MNQTGHSEKIFKIHSVIEQVRGLLLDDIELELGDSPRWPYVRSRLLKYLGDRGLEGRIIEIIKQKN